MESFDEVDISNLEVLKFDENKGVQTLIKDKNGTEYSVRIGNEELFGLDEDLDSNLSFIYCSVNNTLSLKIGFEEI